MSYSKYEMNALQWGRDRGIVQHGIGLGHGLLGEGAAVVAGVFMQGHIKPALRLAQMVITHRHAALIELVNAPLQSLVGLVVGVDGAVRNAIGHGRQLVRGQLPQR